MRRARCLPRNAVRDRRELEVATLAQRFLRQLEPVFPGDHADSGTAGRRCQTPMLGPRTCNCSYSYWKVGQYAGFSGYGGRCREGNIHFAGEHCSQDFRSYMEGGASAGICRRERDPGRP